MSLSHPLAASTQNKCLPSSFPNCHLLNYWFLLQRVYMSLFANTIVKPSQELWSPFVQSPWDSPGGAGGWGSTPELICGSWDRLVTLSPKSPSDSPGQQLSPTRLIPHFRSHHKSRLSVFLTDWLQTRVPHHPLFRFNLLAWLTEFRKSACLPLLSWFVTKNTQVSKSAALRRDI